MRLARALPLAGLGLLVSLGGCASCDDVRCDVDPNPPFGQGIGRFVDRVASLPEWAREDYDERTGYLEDWRQVWAAKRADETNLTMARFSDLDDDLSDQFTERGGSMVDWFRRGSARVHDDACCFFSRAWHEIKLITD